MAETHTRSPETTPQPRVPPRPTSVPVFKPQIKTKPQFKENDQSQASMGQASLGRGRVSLVSVKSTPHTKKLTDFSRLLSEEKLPLCVRATSPFSTKGNPVTIEQNDVLMVHYVDQSRMVLGVDSKGKKYKLPIYAKQLYQILPLDHRLDDKIFKGTASLVEADPCPTAVRVIEGYFSEEEEDTKEVDDVIQIKEIKTENGEKVLIGDSGGYTSRYRGIRDTAVYTTMIHIDHLPLSQVIKHRLPLRVRTVRNEGAKEEQIILRLEKILDERRVVVTRGSDGIVFTVPLSTPLQVEKTIPVWSDIKALVRPMYDASNSSIWPVDISKAPLPVAMQQIPQPIKKVLRAYHESHEGKWAAAKVAAQDRKELQDTLATVRDELERATRELKSLVDREETNAAEQPKSPTPPADCPSLSPGIRAAEASHAKGSDNDSERGEYQLMSPTRKDIIELETSAMRALAKTDLEKTLKRILDEKVLELKEQSEECKKLKQEYEKLVTALARKKMEILEHYDDENDCYNVMSPSPTNLPPTGISRINNERPINTKKRHTNNLSIVVPRPLLPLPDVPCEPTPDSHGSGGVLVPRQHPELPSRPMSIPFTQSPKPKPPNMPLPSIPLEPPPSEDRRRMPGEYDPPIVHTKAYEKHQLPSRAGGNVTIKKLPYLPPSSSRPSSAIIPDQEKPTLSPPIDHSPSGTMTRKADSFKMSKLAITSQSHKVEEDGKSSRPNVCVYDLPYEVSPDSPPPSRLAPLPPEGKAPSILYDTTDTNIEAFTKEDVSRLLMSLGLEDCAKRFLKECVDGSLLLGIDEDMMINDLGMTSSQARKLTMTIDKLSAD